MSVNGFDTKLWLLWNSILDCFAQLKEKHVQISKFVLGFQAQLYFVYGKRLRQIYNYDLYFVYL